jgi:hypothetical protein
VAFIMGRALSPARLLLQLLTTLNTMQADYQVVNVLTRSSTRLRDAIKEYPPGRPSSAHIEGEFVGPGHRSRDVRQRGTCSVDRQEVSRGCPQLPDALQTPLPLSALYGSSLLIIVMSRVFAAARLPQQE